MFRSTPLLAALLLTVPAMPAMAQPNAPAAAQPGQRMMAQRGPMVSLSVTESVDAAPDIAMLSTGVETRAQTAKAAMTQNAAKIDTLIAALVKAGIERKDIQTSGINLNPQYDYSNRTEGEGPRFLGYQANNNLSVTIRKIDKAGELIDAMVAAGATNINGPSFSIADTEPLLNQARTKAIATAQARANLYAQATGYRSAHLVAIDETGGSQPMPPMPYMRGAAVAQDAATKIEPGQLSTSITLNFRYMLER